MVFAEASPDHAGALGQPEVVVEEDLLHADLPQPTEGLDVFFRGRGVQGCPRVSGTVRATAHLPVLGRAQRHGAVHRPQRVAGMSERHIAGLGVHAHLENAFPPLLDPLGRIGPVPVEESGYPQACHTCIPHRFQQTRVGLQGIR